MKRRTLFVVILIAMCTQAWASSFINNLESNIIDNGEIRIVMNSSKSHELFMTTQASLSRKISHYFYDHRNGEISADSYLYVRNHGYDETTCTIIVDSWIAMHRTSAAS